MRGVELSAIKVYSRLPYPLTSGHIPPRTLFFYFTWPPIIHLVASAFYLGKEIYGSCLMDARAIELATHPRLQLLKVERTHTISIFLETLKQQEGEELLVNILVLSRPLLFLGFVFFDASSSNKHGQTT